MSESHSIAELEIVGYAAALPDTMLPAVVPPVFRLKRDQSHILLPPFTIKDRAVHGATSIRCHEMDALCEAEEVTTLPEPIEPQMNHELWVGLDCQVHYDEVSTASAKLRKIAMERIELATEALRAGNFDDAQEHSRTALCADDRLMEPLAITAAIGQKKGQPGQERLMAKLAEGYLTPTGFAHLVAGYSELTKNVPNPAPDLFSGHPMAGIAAIRVDMPAPKS